MMMESSPSNVSPTERNWRFLLSSQVRSNPIVC
jgi:hypothetical protein